MSANRTNNAHPHRIRHRRRLDVAHPNFAARHRKLNQYLTLEAARLNTVGTIAGVTDAEVLAAHTIAALPLSLARNIRAISTNAEATAQGIPVV